MSLCDRGVLPLQAILHTIVKAGTSESETLTAERGGYN